MKAEVIQPVEKDPFQDEITAFWSSYAKDLVRKSTATIDETAKQIIAVTGILEGLYFHAIAYSDLRGQVLSVQALLIYMTPLFLLLISLIGALFVFYPERYQMDIRAPKAAELIHSRVVRIKYQCLLIASIFLILGVASLIFALVYYLRG